MYSLVRSWAHAVPTREAVFSENVPKGQLPSGVSESKIAGVVALATVPARGLLRSVWGTRVTTAFGVGVVSVSSARLLSLPPIARRSSVLNGNPRESAV